MAAPQPKAWMLRYVQMWSDVSCINNTIQCLRWVLVFCYGDPMSQQCEKYEASIGQAVDAAVKLLKDMSCLTRSGDLTVLGLDLKADAS